ncbi:MAG: TMEM14 family protein [Limisphaerales bacterium]
MQFENIVFWCYIILLLIGGLIGFFRAGSKVSLITSAVAAAILILTQVADVIEPVYRRSVGDIIMVILLVVFAWRLSKTKKFIPNGLMMILTVVVLALLNLRRTW